MDRSNVFIFFFSDKSINSVGDGRKTKDKERKKKSEDHVLG